MATSWREIERHACPLCGAGTGESCQTIGHGYAGRSTAPHKARRVLCDGPEFDAKAARAAGWVPLADVLDALRDDDAYHRWRKALTGARPEYPPLTTRRHLADYLAERFAPTTAPEGGRDG